MQVLWRVWRPLVPPTHVAPLSRRVVVRPTAPVTMCAALLAPLARQSKRFRADHTPRPSGAAVPSILFFGGDAVSVTALEAIHQRQAAVLARGREQAVSGAGLLTPSPLEAPATVAACPAAPPLVVICSSLPCSPEELAASGQIHENQYPLARYCLRNAIPFLPISHPTSLSKSSTLSIILGEAVAESDLTSAVQQRANGSGRVKVTKSSTACRTKGAVKRSSAADDPPYVRPDFLRFPLSSFDLIVVVSCRYFLPARLLRAMSPTPVINLHPSLLPKYRGASPIYTTLLRNEKVGGASIIQIPPPSPPRGPVEPGVGRGACTSLEHPATSAPIVMDAGDVLWQHSVTIPNGMDIRSYFPMVTAEGARGLCDIIFGVEPRTAEGQVALARDGEAQAASAEPRHSTESQQSAVEATPVSSFSDWPVSLQHAWKSSTPQPNNTLHFTQDPYHAGLLKKERVCIRWAACSGLEAYGTFRAFVGGQFFTPTVNTKLDKGRTPVKLQLRQRIVNKHRRQQGEQRQSVADRDDAPEDSWSGCVADLTVDCTFTAAVHPEDVPTAVQKELKDAELCYAAHAYVRHRLRKRNSVAAVLMDFAYAARSTMNERLRRGPSTLRRRSLKVCSRWVAAATVLPKAASAPAQHASCGDGAATEAKKRTPHQVSNRPAVTSVYSGEQQQQPKPTEPRVKRSDGSPKSHEPGADASATMPRGGKPESKTPRTTATESGRKRSESRTGATAPTEVDSSKRTRGARGGESSEKERITDRQINESEKLFLEEFFRYLSPALSQGSSAAPLGHSCSDASPHGPTRHMIVVDQHSVEEGDEDVCDSIPVSTAASASAQQSLTASTGGYVPRSLSAALLWMKSMCSPRRDGGPGAYPKRNFSLTLTLGEYSAEELVDIFVKQCAIPPGTAYFPLTSPSLCAVKCAEGWFFWTEAMLKNSTPQPANLIRTGLAMKRGRLYNRLFVTDTPRGPPRPTE